MKKFLLLITLVLTLGLSGQASADTVGGVTWDPDSFLDFSSFSIAIHQDIDATTGVVSGYGFVSTMNGTDQSMFVPGGELTFTFGDYIPVGSTILPGGINSAINYIGGWVNLYVDDTPEITTPSDPTTLTLANTSDGDLWLGLTAHTDSTSGFTLLGSVDAGGGLGGIGSLDATSGLALANFDTNTRADGADLFFSNSFTLFLYNAAGELIDDLDPNDPNADFESSLLHADGTGNYFGDTISQIPEPATILLFGIGLIGLAGFGRKKD